MTGAHDDPALLLRDFVNTYDVEPGTDHVSTPELLAEWLAGRGLVSAGTTATGDDLATATALREGLREAMAAHHSPRDADLPDELEDALAALPLRVTFTGGAPGWSRSTRPRPPRAAWPASPPRSPRPPPPGHGRGSRSARRAPAAGRSWTPPRTGPAPGAP